MPRRRPNSMHCTLHFFPRNPIEPTAPAPAGVIDVPMHLRTEQEQLRLLPCKCHRLNSAERELGAGLPQTHLAFAALGAPRVGASRKKVYPLFLVINSLVCKCNRGLRCQLSCAKYQHHIPTPGGNPMAPGIIMPTYHGRHVVATRPGLPPSSDAIGTRGTKRLSRPSPPATIICRCNQHTTTGCQVTWSRP